MICSLEADVPDQLLVGIPGEILQIVKQLSAILLRQGIEQVLPLLRCHAAHKRNECAGFVICGHGDVQQTGGIPAEQGNLVGIAEIAVLSRIKLLPGDDVGLLISGLCTHKLGTCVRQRNKFSQFVGIPDGAADGSGHSTVLGANDADHLQLDAVGNLFLEKGLVFALVGIGAVLVFHVQVGRQDYAVRQVQQVVECVGGRADLIRFAFLKSLHQLCQLGRIPQTKRIQRHIAQFIVLVDDHNDLIVGFWPVHGGRIEQFILRIQQSLIVQHLRPDVEAGHLRDGTHDGIGGSGQPHHCHHLRHDRAGIDLQNPCRCVLLVDVHSQIVGVLYGTDDVLVLKLFRAVQILLESSHVVE